MVEIRKDTGVEQAEEIPLSARLGLEVPEDETLRLLLIHVELCVDVILSIGLLGLIPGVDEVDITAGARTGSAAWEVAFPARTKSVTVERGGAVSHGRGPLTNNHPVVAVGSVRRSIAANLLYMLLHKSQ